MDNLKVKHLVNSLEKWLKICTLLENNHEEEIVRAALEQLIQYKEIDLNNIRIDVNIGVKKENSKNPKVKKLKNSNENKELIKYYIEAFNKKDVEKFQTKKFKLINFQEDIKVTWKNSDKESKERATNLELNLIYNIIYNFDNIMYINKKKSIIIKDIDQYIKNIVRNNAIDKLPIK